MSGFTPKGIPYLRMGVYNLYIRYIGDFTSTVNMFVQKDRTNVDISNSYPKAKMEQQVGSS